MMVRFLLIAGITLVLGVAQAAPLKIGVSETILSLPLFVAQAEGYFQKRGVNVEFVSCIGGNRCVRNMLAGGVRADVTVRGRLATRGGALALRIDVSDARSGRVLGLLLTLEALRASPALLDRSQV